MFGVNLADRRRDAESSLKADIAAIPESEDAETYLPAIQTFGSTLFDAGAENALEKCSTEEQYTSFMREDLAPELIESIMPDRGLTSVRSMWSPELAKLSTEKEIGSEILWECRPDGTKVYARREILAADAPHGDFENFAPAAIRFSLRFQKNDLIRESLRQMMEKRIHYWIGRFRIQTATVAPASIPSQRRMGTPSLDTQRSFPPSRHSFTGGPGDPKLRTELYEEIGWLARKIQVLEGPPGLPPSEAVDRLLSRLTAQTGGEVGAEFALNELRKHCRASGVHSLETGEPAKAAAFEELAVRFEGLHAKYLSQPAKGPDPAATKPPPLPDEEDLGNASARQAIVMPILTSKGWSRGKWATQAGVGKNSVYEYLDGKRQLTPENRRAMAEVLGLEPEDLPQ